MKARKPKILEFKRRNIVYDKSNSDTSKRKSERLSNNPADDKDHNDHEILVYPTKEHKDRIVITEKDLRCLEPKNLLNDNIISFYLSYFIRDILNKPLLLDKVQVFSTFFFSKLKTICSKKLSYDSIERWHKDMNIFEKDFLVLPVCENDHWYLMIVCYAYNIFEQSLDKYKSIDTIDPYTKAPVIIVLNSLPGQLPHYTRPLRAFLYHEWRKFRPHLVQKQDATTFDRKELGEVWGRVPRQNNDYDCGLYLLQNFECFFQVV